MGPLAHREARSCMVHVLVIRVLALFAFVGGPLFIYDILKRSWDSPAAFVVTFLPVGFMILGALSLGDRDEDRLSAVAAVLGIAGAALLLAQNAYAAYKMISGFEHPNQRLIILGTIVGVAGAVMYTHLAIRFLRRD